MNSHFVFSFHGFWPQSCLRRLRQNPTVPGHPVYCVVLKLRFVCLEGFPESKGGRFALIDPFLFPRKLILKIQFWLFFVFYGQQSVGFFRNQGKLSARAGSMKIVIRKTGCFRRHRRRGRFVGTWFLRPKNTDGLCLSTNPWVWRLDQVFFLIHVLRPISGFSILWARFHLYLFYLACVQRCLKLRNYKWKKFRIIFLNCILLFQ